MTETAISGTRRQYKEMADGTLRVSIDIEPRFVALFHKLFPSIDLPVAMAPLTPAFDKPESAPQHYGEQAKALRLSPFFRMPVVWGAIGSDEDFAQWIQKQKCCICRGFDWVESIGEGRCEAAHVRRAGESGTGYKGNYARVPMCHAHHTLQHNQGEAAVLLGAKDRPGEQITATVAEMWFDRRRIDYVQAWAWSTLKEKLGFESWTEIAPPLLFAWALKHGVESFLPNEYQS